MMLYFKLFLNYYKLKRDHFKYDLLSWDIIIKYLALALLR